MAEAREKLPGRVEHIGEPVDLTGLAHLQRSMHRYAFAECVGTFFYTLVVCGAVISSGTLTYQLNYMQVTVGRVMAIALASGMTYAGLQFMAAPYSFNKFHGAVVKRKLLLGHYNPCITMAAVLVGEVSWSTGMMFLVSQFFGASLSAIFLVLFVPDARSTQLGTTIPAEGTTVWHALGMELFLTFFFTIAVLAITVGRRDAKHNRFLADFAPLLSGLTLFVVTGVGAGVSGASLNPARSWGPALVSITWEHHWVYWVGPLFGAILAAFVFILLRGVVEDRVPELVARQQAAEEEEKKKKKGRAAAGAGAAAGSEDELKDDGLGGFGDIDGLGLGPVQEVEDEDDDEEEDGK